MGLDARKHVFGWLQATKAQTSLRIRTVWSAPFVIHLLESIVFRLASRKISIF